MPKQIKSPPSPLGIQSAGVGVRRVRRFCTLPLDKNKKQKNQTNKSKILQVYECSR
eukprot:m.167018 g.167018  ORF g.167018 m.167018 type:complete len:56 (-) comp31451_c0_seq1:93-260(-)